MSKLANSKIYITPNKPIIMTIDIGHWVDKAEAGKNIVCFRVTSDKILEEEEIAKLKEQLQNPPYERPLLAVDFTATEHLSSAAFAPLIAAKKARELNGNHVGLIGISKQIHDTLKIIRGEDLFKLYGSLKKAKIRYRV